MAQGQSIRTWKLKLCGLISSGDSEFFNLFHACDKKKKHLSLSSRQFTSLHPSYIVKVFANIDVPVYFPA